MGRFSIWGGHSTFSGTQHSTWSVQSSVPIFHHVSGAKPFPVAVGSNYLRRLGTSSIALGV